MNREQAPLRIRLQQSRILILYRHLLHALLAGYCGVAAATISYPIAMLLPITWLALSWVLLLRNTRARAGAQTTIGWAPDGSWLIEEAGGTIRHYPLLHSCFNTHWLTILGFRRGLFGRRYYLLLADNCDPAQRRRLRVRLKQQVSRQLPAVDNYSVSER
ncbi:protein YgfX [Sedimenticola hydrogenitrophicus]|uniref:protein YgfX n=1 Tax=Sedimenticola hydrogenitrophicus TaxID=2967975 RepID=UPI0021A40998|nr:protein YgfX [Sedimenticola hydrogenitrophicus]